MLPRPLMFPRFIGCFQVSQWHPEQGKDLYLRTPRSRNSLVLFFKFQSPCRAAHERVLGYHYSRYFSHLTISMVNVVRTTFSSAAFPEGTNFCETSYKAISHFCDLLERRSRPKAQQANRPVSQCDFPFSRPSSGNAAFYVQFYMTVRGTPMLMRYGRREEHVRDP